MDQQALIQELEIKVATSKNVSERFQEAASRIAREGNDPFDAMYDANLRLSSEYRGKAHAYQTVIDMLTKSAEQAEHDNWLESAAKCDSFQMMAQ